MLKNLIERIKNFFKKEDKSHKEAMEALEKVEVGDYSCILLDLRLNGIGGPEVYRRIADRDQETADKIIFITGDTASPATSSFLSTVGNTVIPKPFTLKQVRDSISAIR